MPTADEFDALAATFATQAERLAGAADAVDRRRLDQPIVAPVIVIPLRDRIAGLIDQCRSAARHCADLASECRHRAEVCRRYSAAIASHQHATAAWERRAREAAPGEWVGSRPQLPLRPAPWAERS